MELIAATAIGLNPYIGMFVLAALAAFTDHVPQGFLLQGAPGLLLAGVAAVYGLAAPIDFVFGKFARYAPVVRRSSQLVAPFTGALGAVAVSDRDLPLGLVAAGGAVLAWTMAAMLTFIAARASRSVAWIGLGHIPVLMAAATAAACIVPLGLAKPVIGYVLSAIAIMTLTGATLPALLGRRAPATPAARTAIRPA